MSLPAKATLSCIPFGRSADFISAFQVYYNTFLVLLQGVLKNLFKKHRIPQGDTVFGIGYPTKASQLISGKFLKMESPFSST